MITPSTYSLPAAAFEIPLVTSASPRHPAVHELAPRTATATAADPDQLVARIVQVIQTMKVTLNGEFLCSQSVLFEGNLSLNGHPQDDQRHRPGRCRSHADLLAAKHEYQLNMARAIAAQVFSH